MDGLERRERMSLRRDASLNFDIKDLGRIQSVAWPSKERRRKKEAQIRSTPLDILL